LLVGRRLLSLVVAVDAFSQTVGARVGRNIVVAASKLPACACVVILLAWVNLGADRKPATPTTQVITDLAPPQHHPDSTET